MSYHHFYKKFAQLAVQTFPGLAEVPPVAWDHLVSPLELHLPKRILDTAGAAIQALHALSRRSAYADRLETVPGISDVMTGHQSVLMAYDFHSDDSGECSLVEINTNASGFLLASLMELTHGGASADSFVPLDLLRQSFVNELRLWGKAAQPPVIAITDEDLLQQKMYPEFVMYRDWFRAGGWQAEFCESRDFTLNKGRLLDANLARVDLVYNRLTDFYFTNPHHQALLEAFQTGTACITPNPREYWLLADKQRLIDLATPGFLAGAGALPAEVSALERVLIPAFEKSAFSSQDEIWAQRKHLFFKPKRSYGGKSVYRGESVSRKVFERLMQEDILIQHYRAAQKMPADDPRSVLNNWKFDLRFYVYGGQIQLVAARIYQGQVTNFAPPLGGFTLVRFS